MKGSTDENDLFTESIIYFYSAKDELIRQKLIECAEIIGLVQYFTYDLFSSVPKEFNFKKSLVLCQHYGRYSAFLILSKDRFTLDEANIHLNHILELFHLLYGTFNSIQSTHSDINQINMYLKQTLTPISEYIFHGNRSIQNLFSVIDYASIPKNHGHYLLNIKHLLQYLKSKYEIKDGLLAYQNRILHSTLDYDTTFYLQLILNLEQNLPENAICISLGSEIKLKSGVSLLRIYVRRPVISQSIISTIDTKTKQNYSNSQIPSIPIDIMKPVFFGDNETSSIDFHSNGIYESQSSGIPSQYNSIISDGLLGSSMELNNCNSVSSLTNTKIYDSSSFDSETKSTSIAQPCNHQSSGALSVKSNDQSSSDDRKRTFRLDRSISTTGFMGPEKPLRVNKRTSLSSDSIEQVTFEPVEKSDYEAIFREEDIICLPPKPAISSFTRTRPKTLTNQFVFNENQMNDSEHQEGSIKWGYVPERNNEIERDELILYIQRNSRMTFAGIIENHSISNEYLQRLWILMVTEMANMDKDIQVMPVEGEINKSNIDTKFQFSDVTHQVEFERILDSKQYYYKTPVADQACMAFSARAKLNQSSERKMIGLLRGNNQVSIHQNLPQRATYFCRRVKEFQ